jgi:hypothetical protein
MADSEAGGAPDALSPELLEGLALAEEAADRFAGAGLAPALWELFVLSQGSGAFLRQEVGRLAAGGAPAPEVLEELRRLRAEREDSIAGVRAFLPPARDAEHARLQEMLLGFIAVSPAALEAAARWRASPDACREEALGRIALIESIVDRYRRALDRPDAKPVARPEEPPAPVPAPPAPSGLVATATDGRVSLAWTAVPGATGYRVKRSTAFRGPFAPVGEPADPAFVDTTVVNGTAYFYYVLARNSGGESPRSSRARARPMAPPAAPSSVAAVPGDGRVTVTWAPAERAARYRVRRALARRGPYTLAGSTDGTSYVDAAVANGTTYFYTVIAVNVGGKSPHSAPVQATPLPAFLVPPAAPPPAASSTGEVPLLEQSVVPALGALPEGVNLERLLDLKQLGRLRRLFEQTAQTIEIWEAFCVIADDETGTRRAVEEILRRWDRGDAAGANEEAALFFEKVLRARAEHGKLARDLRSYLEGLGLDGRGDGALEIAMAFILSAPRSRRRASRWIEEPERERPQAAAYLEHALGIARLYGRALGPAP